LRIPIDMNPVVYAGETGSGWIIEGYVARRVWTRFNLWHQQGYYSRVDLHGYEDSEHLIHSGTSCKLTRSIAINLGLPFFIYHTLK